jgi:hypothetical protein
MNIELDCYDGKLTFTDMTKEDLELLTNYIERRTLNLKNSIGHLNAQIKERGWTLNDYKLPQKQKELNFWLTILVILKCHPENK